MGVDYKMKKKIIVIAIILVIGILLFGRGFLVQNVYIDVIGKGENGIDYILKTAIRVQYGWGNIDDLNQICTEEFLDNVNLDEVYLGRKLYTIEKGYMDTAQQINENELKITVPVYSPDIRFHHFTLIQDENGKYRINGIEHDM